MRLIAPRPVPLALVLLAMLAAGLAAWHLSWAAALRQLDARAEAELSQTSARLIAQLQSYRELSVLLAGHPHVTALLTPRFAGFDDMATAGALAEADDLLLRMADTVRALHIMLLDAGGNLLAGSSDAIDPAVRAMWEPAIARALTGALGRFTGRDAQAERRSFGFASPVHGVEGAAATGAILVVANLETIEAEWRADPSAVYFADEAGRVMVSNRSELVWGGAAADLPQLSAQGQAGLWRVRDGGPYLPRLALRRIADLPVIGMTGTVLVDAARAQQVVLMQTALAVFAAAVLGALSLWVMARRDRMAARLAAEARAKEVLETRVAERTAELMASNRALRREIAERKEAEAQLKATQDRLVQAGKLSALGEMSAGISHELNQPLMAIRSFAENAELLLEKGRIEVVAQNLSRISALSRRMARIIKNLRAFARQEDAPVRPVDAVQVIEASLEMVGARIQSRGVALDWRPPARPVRVMAGEVRLQQVVLNLLSNALDAMENTEFPALAVAVVETAGQVRISVSDRGPGIAAPDRIFDPFYTTKEVGPAEGMGLGLSISYGLVQSFGGAIDGRNGEAGGAVFTVTLPRVAEDAAA